MLGWLFGKKTQNSDGLVCVACNSTNVTELAPQTYRCNVCAYEGGDGFADWQDMKTRAAYDDWSVAQLREHAAAQLNEARSALVGVDGMTAPSSTSTGTYATVGGLTVWTGGNSIAGESDRDLAEQLAADKLAAVARAAAGLRAAALTLDALVDKGDVHLGAVLYDARHAVSATDDASDAARDRLQQLIEACLEQLDPGL